MNNFYKLKSYVDNLEVDDFLYIEIMIRNKDQKDNIGKNNRIIKSYKVDILTDLNRLEEDIKKLCKAFNARAYVYLSPRNNEKVFSEMLLLMANYNKMKNYDSINRVFDKALKSIKGSMKHFIIDIDTKDLNYVTNVREEIIDKLDYTPNNFDKKVYIIDEAHMLSKSAWNALLKTIEETPSF